MILVTGATGNVGSEVLSQLAAARWPVRAFVRDPHKATPWADRVEIAEGDFNDTESFARAADGATAALLIAVSGFADHAAGLLRAAQASGVARVVLVSGSVAEWPDSDVGKWFRNCEDAVRNCGLGWTILRPCNFMSNAYQWISSITREGAVYNPTGGGKAALIAPEDVALVAANYLKSPGGDSTTVQLTGGEVLDVLRQVKILAQILGKPIRCVDVSIQAATEKLIGSGMPEASARFTAEIYERTLRGQAAALTQDFIRITGNSPRTFRSWVHDHIGKFLRPSVTRNG
jgi:(4-alkanoyl-5-oxo-2,5-dihydrofuran-3-yl)methyl phosphate reductase